MNNHLVILAGGLGGRFWPLSNQKCPKQFRDILKCGRTLLQMTFDHFAGMFESSNIWVVTNKAFISYVKEQLPEILDERILCEPESRNTAPSIAYVSWKIKSIDARANVVVTPSDHFITNLKAFQESVHKCIDFTAETDSIAMIGIRPTTPETEYGYIEADLSFASSRHPSIYRVDHFIEKPSKEVALDYLKSKGTFWNSGIFVWNVSTIVNAYRIYQPIMANLFESILPYYGTEKEKQMIEEHFCECENISVDYAIMEKVEEIFVCSSNFGWRDLGSWKSLYEELAKDAYENACVGDIKLFDTNHCLIHASSLKKVVVQGLEKCIVSENDGVLLICKMEDEQRIKLFHDKE